MVPLLVIFADGIGTGGSWYKHACGDVSLHISKVFDSLAFHRYNPDHKTFFFGFFIGMIDVIKDLMLKMEQQVWDKLQISRCNSITYYFIIDMLAVQLTDLLFKMEQEATTILPQ
jgi:hypothetical protein